MSDDKKVEALQHIAEGKTIDQTAEEMNLSRSMVEKYLLRIRRDLKATTLANAVYLAVKSGLIACVCLACIFSIDDLRPRRMRTRRERGDVLDFLDDFQYPDDCTNKRGTGENGPGGL